MATRPPFPKLGPWPVLSCYHDRFTLLLDDDGDTKLAMYVATLPGLEDNERAGTWLVGPYDEQRHWRDPTPVVQLDEAPPRRHVRLYDVWPDGPVHRVTLLPGDIIDVSEHATVEDAYPGGGHLTTPFS